MKMIRYAAVATALTLSTAAPAAITVDITESGSDILVSVNGSMNLTGLTYYDQDKFNESGIRADSAIVSTVANPLGNFDIYTGFTSGRRWWGDGLQFYPFSNVSGSQFAFGIAPSAGAFLYLDAGYASGSAIASSASLLGQSFASAGLEPGQYVYKAPNDTLTVNIGRVASTVPEPTTWAMMIAGFGLAAGTLRRQRKTTLAIACS